MEAICASRPVPICTSLISKVSNVLRVGLYASRVVLEVDWGRSLEYNQYLHDGFARKDR